MDLIEVDLDKLGTAVSDWKSAADKLKIAADNARKGMQAKSDKARWAGANASVTRGFVSKTTKEVADLHTEADSIYRVLDDAHTELVSLQKQIQVAHGEVQKRGIRVDDYGDGTVHCVYPHIRGDTDVHTPEENEARDELQARIGRILSHASEIDASVTRALRKSHGSDPHNAGHSSYKSLDEAQVERAAELAKLGPKMTDKQFTELNSIMKWNAKDADFSTGFYKSLGGPEETLDFYGRMALEGTQGDDKERLALTRQLQRNMGNALATATDPDNKPHLSASWGEEFRKLGTQSIEIDPGAPNSPYGYQILGGLLRYGSYDSEFINPIAEHIVQLHHKEPEFFMNNKPVTGGVDLDWGYNPSGKAGAGYDPLTSVLEGLGHSPDAAKKFFSDDMTPTVYNEDGTVKKGATLDYDYYDELTKKDFEWLGDSLVHPGSDEAAHARDGGPDALGHALEAATLGYAYDDPTPTPSRDATSAAIMEKVVQTYGDPENVKDPISDSLGRMGAGYIDDLNWGLNENRTDSLFTPTDPEGHAQFGSNNAIKFLSSIGQHPDAYSEISVAQQIYGTSALEAQVDGDRINEPHAREIVRTGAEIQGILDESRADQVQAEGLAKDAAYNKSLAEKTEWIKFGAGVGIAAGAAFLPPVAAVGVAGTLIPVFMDAGQGALTQQIGTVIGDSAETRQQDSANTIQDQRREIFRAGRVAAASPMEAFMADHGIRHDDGGFGQDLEDAQNGGYLKGTNGEDQLGVLPTA
ncbi:hypothetical protein ADK57_45145 [Streptomyces sp. MMG1533]|uniref:DUF6571 family protein n=1 Tax=Streptomyces sp. MMG1533 TaxID=1415546 RepID=UPI0006C4A08D|nr:DUF6571 family protein [Streptomyces sp. MMG1533]KOU55251.1 hypothetical protein ADK57_45145 [Streptomyces sp. MMG1533]